jgi:hypothetical protein
MKGKQLCIGTDFNSELFVVEPSTRLWNDVRSQVELQEVGLGTFGIDEGKAHS